MNHGAQWIVNAKRGRRRHRTASHRYDWLSMANYILNYYYI